MLWEYDIEVVISVGRRSEFEMFFDTLDVIYKGVDIPTRIMLLSNQSWGGLRRTLQKLINGNLITRKLSGKQNRYYITSSGIEACKYWTIMLKIVEDSNE
jgi:predicted transcriptional regulator